MMDSGAQGILRSVKLFWVTEPKGIKGTTSAADPNSNCGLSGVTGGSVQSAQLCSRAQTVDETVSGARGRKQRRILSPLLRFALNLKHSNKG